jgi:colicin import membrane protein
MAEHRETSLIFSLEGLLQRERERIHEEEAQHRERLREAHERQVNAEREAREDEERRRAEQEQRFREERLRAREEAARVEALRHAELERARVDAQARARLEVMAQQQEHERRMADIRKDVVQRRSRLIALTSSALAAALAFGAAALWFGKIAPEGAALQRAYDDLVAAERRRADETRRLVARAEQRRVELLDELERTTNRLHDVEGELERGDERRPPTTRRRPANPVQPPGRPAPREECKDDGDPLNGCLRKR